MYTLGKSIYPKHSTLEKDCEYRMLATNHGFHRIFTCLQSVDTEPMVFKYLGVFHEV